MMTDTVIVSILTLFGIAVNSLVAFFIAKLNIKASEAAKEVKEVKVNLKASNEVVETKLDSIHTLVNSQLGVQLKLNANNSRWRADMSKKPEDIKAADEAEKLLKEHEHNALEEKQKVDSHDSTAK